MSPLFTEIVAQMPPPAHFTPLRANGHLFAAAAGYALCEVKLREHKGSAVFAYDVFVREPGAKRGKKIGSLLAAALEEFGPYRYR